VPYLLTRDNVRRLLEDLERHVPRDECRSCDCLQGFLKQLELNAAEDVRDLLAPHVVPRDTMHGCLGCDPCPPGAAYADYLRRKNAENKESDS
jgi:hypothetical protein